MLVPAGHGHPGVHGIDGGSARTGALGAVPPRAARARRELALLREEVGGDAPDLGSGAGGSPPPRRLARRLPAAPHRARRGRGRARAGSGAPGSGGGAGGTFARRQGGPRRASARAAIGSRARWCSTPLPRGAWTGSAPSRAATCSRCSRGSPASTRRAPTSSPRWRQEASPGPSPSGSAMALEPGGRGFLLSLDLPGLESLFRSVLAEDDWDVVTSVPEGHRVAFVVGARSGVVDPAARARLAALGPAVTLEEIPGAGHWLHVDAPEATFAAVGRALPKSGRPRRGPGQVPSTGAMVGGDRAAVSAQRGAPPKKRWQRAVAAT